MQTTTVSDRGRAEFEKWAKTKAQDWFAYEPDEYANMFARDGEGYTDCNVHSAWMGWQAYRLTCGHAAYDNLKTR